MDDPEKKTMLKVLVVDDSLLFRMAMSEAISRIDSAEVVGTAANGKIALQKIAELKPDLLTLDLEMPVLDGLSLLDELKKSRLDVAVIVISALSIKGAAITMRAMEKGAFDFITKPEAANKEESIRLLQQELSPRLNALNRKLEIRRILNRPASGAAPAAVSVRAGGLTKQPAAPAAITTPLFSQTARPSLAKTVSPAPGMVELILIGVSTGGPNALAVLLPQLPKGLGLPILIVQHMPPIFTKSLADSLNSKCAIEVKEASHEELIVPDTAYIAPGGKQMRIAPGANGCKIIQITDDPPENNCKPAVDYLFRSAANKFPGRSMAVILTGMGSDGTLGLRLLKRHGCHSIAQSEASCVVYGMPKAAAEAGVVDHLLPIESIAGQICVLARRKTA